MWILKDKEAVLKERKRKYLNPKIPIFTSLAIFFLFSFLVKVDWQRGEIPPIGDPISWSEYWEEGFPKALIFSIAVFFVIYIWRIYFKQRTTPCLICKKCNEIKSNDGNMRCKCGGEFVFMDEMEWKEG